MRGESEFTCVELKSQGQAEKSGRCWVRRWFKDSRRWSFNWASGMGRISAGGGGEGRMPGCGNSRSCGLEAGMGHEWLGSRMPAGSTVRVSRKLAPGQMTGLSRYGS